eukprot:1927574-Amphidinium_carterae.1
MQNVGFYGLNVGAKQACNQKANNPSVAVDREQAPVRGSPFVHHSVPQANGYPYVYLHNKFCAHCAVWALAPNTHQRDDEEEEGAGGNGQHHVEQCLRK